jgi:hypothetical protein
VNFLTNVNINIIRYDRFKKKSYENPDIGKPGRENSALSKEPW